MENEKVCKNCKHWSVNKFDYAVMMLGGWSYCNCEACKSNGKKTQAWQFCKHFENK